MIVNTLICHYVYGAFAFGSLTLSGRVAPTVNGRPTAEGGLL